VGIVRLPALRERASDIPLLSQAALQNANSRLPRPKQLTPAALERLVAQEWPGNVRALMNVMERSAQLTRGDVIDAADLQLSDDGGAPPTGLPEPHVGFDVQAWLDKARHTIFHRALDLAGGNASAAARLLNVTPQAVSKFTRTPGQ
jgi:DNA-binding NtrC family response regulator